MTKSQNSFELEAFKVLSEELNTVLLHSLCIDWFLLLILVAEEIIATIIIRSTFIKKFNKQINFWTYSFLSHIVDMIILSKKINYME